MNPRLPTNAPSEPLLQCGDPSMTRGVIVVGSVNVDLILQVSRLPSPGETVIGGSFV